MQPAAPSRPAPSPHHTAHASQVTSICPCPPPPAALTPPPRHRALCQVSELLDASPVWQAYCHQRHDLFLLPGSTTGPQGTVVGLLEAAPGAARYALPPPEALGQ